MEEKRPRGRPRSMKNGGVLFWKVPIEQKIPQKRGPKKNPVRTYRDLIDGPKIKQGYRYAFWMFVAKSGQRKRVPSLNRLEGVTTAEIFKYMDEPPERYELDGNRIIRTVDTFHYIGKHTIGDGKCRSFNALHRKFSRNTTGKEEIPHVSDIVWEVFRRRYFLGRLVKHDSGKNSDLSHRIKWVSFMLNDYKYHIVCLANDSDGQYTHWRMYKSEFFKYKLNPTVPLKMTQEEIIENLKKGTIKQVNKYGNPEIVYTPQEVLDILGIK